MGVQAQPWAQNLPLVGWQWQDADWYGAFWRNIWILTFDWGFETENICRSVYSRTFQRCLEKRKSHFFEHLFISIRIWGFLLFCWPCCWGSTHHSKEQSLLIHINIWATEKITCKGEYPSILPSTTELSGKLQGEGLTLGRMVNGSAYRLCWSGRLHPSERQRQNQELRKFICRLSVGFGPGVYSLTKRKGNCKDEKSRKYLWQERIGGVSDEWRAFL